ncbi:replication initiation protein [Lacticaseibacillus paracasei]|uniref:replication initiation protein n=2 Tax=Lactobacillaceae TaxID=33958 RepID=UPI0021A9BB11|nr:replication initiation protein [Lacticaseibacillus paracasei]MCT4393681.1 RepB family plasmid replication initiator protein [Lacticaseibacillus paracasei]
MSNELVKYQPELNTIPLRKFSPVEMNLFFSIVSRMRDKGEQTVRFSFDELKDLSAYKQTSGKAFVKDLEKTYDHLMDLRFGHRSKTGLSVEKFVMFNKFKINGDASEPYVEIRVQEEALPLLNHLESWVRYALVEFRDLKSSYAKTMFRLLKGYRTTGYACFSKADFLELLDVPTSYRQSDINKYVISPIKEELTPLFRGLTVRKKYGKGRGKPVIGYAFAWKAERKDAEDVHVSNTERLNKAKFNIEHNGELSDKEKWRAIDKIKGLKLGTTEAEHNKQEQETREEQIRAEERQKILEELRNGGLR